MDAHGPGGRGVARVQHKAEAVDPDAREQSDDRHAQGPAPDELQRLQLEDVEADVAVELRIHHPELLGLDELQDQLPLLPGDGAEDDAHEQGADHQRDPGDPLDGLQWHVAERACFGDGTVLGDAPGGDHVDEQEQPGDSEAGEEQPDSGHRFAC